MQYCRKKTEARYLKLEQDRVFHTCHLLPKYKDNGVEIILIGGEVKNEKGSF